MVITTKLLLVTLITFMVLHTNAQDLECQGTLCNPTILNHTTDIKISCNYARMTFTNMTETVLTVGTFRLCAVAKILDLSNNGIRTIKAGTFLGLNALTELYLANNLISEIEPGTFHTLIKLEVFVLAGNQLTTLPEYEFTSRNLKYFNVNHNKLQLLPSTALLNLKAIELLDLSMNSLLELNENALINVMPGATIILSNNRLQNISMNFNGTNPKGESNVQVNGNILKSLKNDTLGMLYKLNVTSLDASYNLIEYIEPGIFERYESIHALFLSHNKIPYLSPNALSGLKKLQLLDVSHNRLDEKIFLLQLPDTARLLNYSHNYIQHVDDFSWVAHTGKRDVRLHLDHNKISYIDANRFCSYISWVKLDYNNWSCSFLYLLIQNLARRLITVPAGVEFKVDNVQGISCNLETSKLVPNASISKIYRNRKTTTTKRPKPKKLTTSPSSLSQPFQSSEGVKIESWTMIFLWMLGFIHLRI